MPYITSERVAEIRKEIKNQFPGFKISVTRRHSSTVCVAIMEAPFDLLPNKEEKHETVDCYIKRHYADLPKTAEVLQKIYDIMDKGNRTMFNDVDYGDVPKFYTDLEIGQWDRPFKVVEK